LDEPTSGLDPQSRIALWEIIGQIHREGQTVVLTTHYMEEADRLCERLAIIDHGKILTLDTPAALKKSLPGGEVLDLWVRAPGSLAPRLQSLEGVNRLEAVAGDGAARGAAEEGGERLRLFVDPKDGLLDRVLHAVREAGGDLQHVSLTPPSLEDVYIHLTGKELRE
jgi:ABC-2 type transport system ATP-binding protein